MAAELLPAMFVLVQQREHRAAQHVGVALRLVAAGPAAASAQHLLQQRLERGVQPQQKQRVAAPQIPK